MVTMRCLGDCYQVDQPSNPFTVLTLLATTSQFASIRWKTGICPRSRDRLEEGSDGKL